MNINPLVFKAYDIRGVVDKDLSEDLVRLVGQVLGSMAIEAGDDAIIIGRDGRLSGPRLCSALSDGIQDSGCNVIDIGPVPTPLVYFATFHLKSSSGVAVTGSHNPPEYNGLKMVIAGETLSGETIQKIYQRILDKDYKSGNGHYFTEDVVPLYQKTILDDVKLARPLNIVLDAGNGIAGGIAPQLFEQLGCKVEPLYCDVDGQFPNHHPDPSRPENLKELIVKVRETGADIGLAFDGDGDRLGVVTPKGDIIWPDRQMILYARDVLTRHPGATIIYDVKCTQTLAAEVEKAGGKAMMWKTGHSFIKSKLKQTGALLAGEMSGHIFFKERWYGFDDGIYTGVRLCELIAKVADIQQLFDDLPNTVNTPEVQIETADGAQHGFVKKLADAANFPKGNISKVDGLRVDYDYGFGLLRASNTTPYVVCRFEADTKENMQAIIDDFAALFKQTAPELDFKV